MVENKIMNQNTFLQRLEALGYYPLPRSHPDSPGYSGLLIILRQAPDGHEPERIQLRLHEWDGKTPKVSLHADMNQILSPVVCPGRIVIRSRQEQEATFYTFGGTLDSEALSGETVFSLRSTAPMLELRQGQETIADLLADETEALFARVEARQQLSSHQMLDRLVAAGPEAVYLAVLQSLLPPDEETAVSHRHIDLITMLQRERDWYQKIGRWPLIPRNLEMLVQKKGER
jgi:hypothetical protein